MSLKPVWATQRHSVSKKEREEGRKGGEEGWRKEGKEEALHLNHVALTYSHP
jgi:hypothetical protein